MPKLLNQTMNEIQGWIPYFFKKCNHEISVCSLLLSGRAGGSAGCRSRLLLHAEVEDVGGPAREVVGHLGETNLGLVLGPGLVGRLE